MHTHYSYNHLEIKRLSPNALRLMNLPQMSHHHVQYIFHYNAREVHFWAAIAMVWHIFFHLQIELKILLNKWTITRQMEPKLNNTMDETDNYTNFFKLICLRFSIA